MQLAGAIMIGIGLPVMILFALMGALTLEIAAAALFVGGCILIRPTGEAS